MKLQNIFFLFVLILLLYNINPASAYELDMTFTDLNEQEQEYHNFEGKPLLVDAFATWCEPCKIEILHLRDMYEILEGSVEILTLSVSPQTDDVDTVKHFRDDYSATWPFGIDSDFIFSDTFETFVIPTLYLFDDQGNLIDHWEGITDPNIVLDTIENKLSIEVNRVDNNLLGLLGLQLVGNNLFQISTSFLAITFTYMMLVPSIQFKKS